MVAHEIVLHLVLLPQVFLAGILSCSLVYDCLYYSDEFAALLLDIHPQDLQYKLAFNQDADIVSESGQSALRIFLLWSITRTL